MADISQDRGVRSISSSKKIS